VSVASHWEVVVKTQKGLLSIAEGLDFVTTSTSAHTQCERSGDERRMARRSRTGKQDPALYWVPIDAFPRETVWEGGLNPKETHRQILPAA